MNEIHFHYSSFNKQSMMLEGKKQDFTQSCENEQRRKREFRADREKLKKYVYMKENSCF